MLSENGRLRIANENFAKANFKLKSLVAKYERVARAAKAIFGVEGMKNLRPLYEELEAALADLPEDALK